MKNAAVVILEESPQYGNSLILYSENRNNNIFYTSPGGHVEIGETPLDGAIRELCEEAYICVPKSGFIKIPPIITPQCYFWILKYRNSIDLQYFYHIRYGNYFLNKNQKEMTGITRIPVAEFIKKINNPNYIIHDYQGQPINLRSCFLKALRHNNFNLIHKIIQAFNN